MFILPGLAPHLTEQAQGGVTMAVDEGTGLDPDDVDRVKEILGNAFSMTRARALIEYFVPSGVGEIEAVGIIACHAPIETVQAYGLTIGVDAHGRAAEISSEYGLQILTD